MLNYTDISSKVEDVQNTLHSLYDLVFSQYDGVFQGEDLLKYQRMIQRITSIAICIDEVKELNERLSDVFKEHSKEATYNAE